jgi:hypothetical protein
MQKQAREVMDAMERCIYLTREASGYPFSCITLRPTLFTGIKNGTAD